MSGWAASRLVSAPVPRTTRRVRPVSSSIGAEQVALPPEIVGRIFAGRDFRHHAVDDGAGWPNEHKRANRPQTRPEQPCEPGIAIEAALDHVPRAAGEIDG